MWRPLRSLIGSQRGAIIINKDVLMKSGEKINTSYSNSVVNLSQRVYSEVTARCFSALLAVDVLSICRSSSCSLYSIIIENNGFLEFSVRRFGASIVKHPESYHQIRVVFFPREWPFLQVFDPLLLRLDQPECPKWRFRLFQAD